jgi:hypothetical protein
MVAQIRKIGAKSLVEALGDVQVRDARGEEDFMLFSRSGNSHKNYQIFHLWNFVA